MLGAPGAICILDIGATHSVAVGHSPEKSRAALPSYAAVASSVIPKHSPIVVFVLEPTGRERNGNVSPLGPSTFRRNSFPC